jgi:hypothetical protein
MPDSWRKSSTPGRTPALRGCVTVNGWPTAISDSGTVVGASYSEPGMGLPCGQVVGLPSTRFMATSTASLITCSHLPASWCASAHDSPSMSVRKRSARRWRRTTRCANSCPLAVRRMAPSLVMRPSASSRRIISLTAGRLTCKRSAMRAWMTRRRLHRARRCTRSTPRRRDGALRQQAWAKTTGGAASSRRGGGVARVRCSWRCPPT